VNRSRRRWRGSRRRNRFSSQELLSACLINFLSATCFFLFFLKLAKKGSAFLPFLAEGFFTGFKSCVLRVLFGFSRWWRRSGHNRSWRGNSNAHRTR